MAFKKNTPAAKTTAPESTKAPLDETKIKEYGEAISDVKVFLYDGGKGGTKGFATVTFGGMIAVRDITVRDGSKGLWVTMPSKPKTAKNKETGETEAVLNETTGKPEYLDIAYPVDAEAREAVSRAVLDKYAQEKARSSKA